ncbi:MAG: amidase family protein [Pigmentiphaga sp.]|uniref:amidase family protein n=1 Tax=Pigmentiphaga sp. TaxID=1977564 RepID=UPI0029B70FA9|nr:amidase family protein [Pigmentiphaga sp.]MDX3904599.1 amidase family protein [Pigmentiphaga sp.]
MTKNQSPRAIPDTADIGRLEDALPDHARRVVLRAVAVGVPSAAMLSMAGGCAAPGAAAGPDRSSGVADLTATEAVRHIRDGDMKAEAYMSVLLDRARRYRSLNAFTWLDESSALQSARAVDLARAQGQSPGMLAGLPLAVKDNIDTVGFPTSAGTPSLKKNFPRMNALVVDKLFGQGAVLLGKTNMHELAIGGTSSNPAFGFVRNPYDTDRIPGGSSGGTAAAIAARIAPAGLGTDTAGSVRIPAAFCGIAALRPTTAGRRGAYSLDGVVPLEFELDTIGPMARTVADVALLDAAISGRRVPSPASLKGLRIGVPRADYWEDLGPGVLDTLESAMARLREHGVAFIDIDMKGLQRRARDVYNQMNAAGFGRDLASYLAVRMPGLTLDQVIEQLASADVKSRFVPWPAHPSDEAMAVLRRQTLPALVAEYREIFRSRRIEALAFPTEPVVAPLILKGGDRSDATVELNGRRVNRGLLLIRNTPATGGIGFPGLSLPAGLSSQGLPVGLELDGLPDTDSALLGIGIAIENALGPLPPPRLAA